MDPQLDYYAPGWELSYATACKLFNYPDKEGAAGSQVVPEVAAGFPTITNRGTTYLFTIRRGFRFNTGEAVTARSFADALNRAASPELQSGAQAFMDVIRGARAVIDGKARNISGLKAAGNRLTIELNDGVPRPARAAGTAVFLGDRPGYRSEPRPRRLRHGAQLRPVLRREPRARQVDHTEAELLLHGPASA